ncbi:sulfatase [Planctomicrobium sp. SH668]|uniref:sulfatase n=1 Tax=Planctomicrobium sp. SH668 TaxID=3448126 RepID=UPI003F5C8011
MTRLNRNWVAALGAALSIVNVAQVVDAADAKKPNIVVIVADDLGYSDLGFQGGKDIPTPHLDQLASEGVRLTSGYVTGPYCSPTRAALLTGRYQQRFGHELNPGANGDRDDYGLSLKEITIADRLKASGYKTALVGKWHLGNAERFHPQKRGFDEFFGFLGGARTYLPENNASAAPIFRGTEPVEETEYLTDAFSREAVDFIDRQNEDPFFLYLAYNAVHSPLQASPADLEALSSIKDEKRRSYAGLLVALDRGVGQLLAKLHEKKLDENTLVIFLSDNGGPLGTTASNAPLRGQKSTTWEGGIRVPFVFRWKGHLPAGTVYDKAIAQIDILPTALALAGNPVKEADQIDGVDVLPYLNGENSGTPHEYLYWRFDQQTAIINGDWKLVKGPQTEVPLLINLKDDIREENDLSSQEPKRVKALQEKWNEWNKTLVEPAWRPLPSKGQGGKKGQGGGKKNQNNQPAAKA